MDHMIGLDARDSNKYKEEAIRNSEFDARKWKGHLLPGLYYLVSRKNYSEKENT